MNPKTPKPFAVLLSVFLLGLIPFSQGQVEELWRTTLTNASVQDFVVDVSGALVLAYPTDGTNSPGMDASSVGVTRVDGQGNRLWTLVLPDMNVTYGGRGFLSKDSVGNTFVVGQSFEHNTLRLTKIGSDGQLLWLVEEPLGNGSRILMAADGAGGVVVAASVYEAEEYRMWMARYRNDGTALWRTNYSIAVNTSAEVIALKVDHEGNCLVQGRAYSNLTATVDVLLKLSPGGSALWSRQVPRQNWAKGGIDAFRVARDGSIFVSLGEAFQKWSPSGGTNWMITNQVAVLDIDADGSLLVSESEALAPPAVMRLGPDGRVLWRTPLQRPAVMVGLDSSGNHVLGMIHPGYWHETIQFTSIDVGGNQIWVFDQPAFAQGFSLAPGLVAAPGGAFRLVAHLPNQPVSPTIVTAIRPVPVTGWPRFTVHPTNQTAAAHGAAQLRVEVVSDSPAQLQWYRGAFALPGQTNSMLALTALSNADTGDYYVEARNAKGTVFSRMGTVRVVYPPSVWTPVQYVSLPLNGSVDLPTYPSGTAPFNFCWFRNGSLLAGETNSVLRLHDAQESSAGEYSVSASNDAGTSTNVVASVRVTPAVALVWSDERAVDGSGDQSCEQAIHPDGSLFVATGKDVIRYSAAGDPTWATNDFAVALIPDDEGGAIYGSYPRVSRVDATGALLWQISGGSAALARWGGKLVLGGAAVFLYELDGMLVDMIEPECVDCSWYQIGQMFESDSGNLVCAGAVSSEGGGQELAVASLGPTGETQWFFKPDLRLNTWQPNEYGFFADPAGGAILAVIVKESSAAERRLIVLRIDEAGGVKWRAECDGLPDEYGSIHVAIDNMGNVVVTAPGCVAKFDSNGVQLWRIASGHPQFGVHRPYAMTLGHSDEIYLVGTGENYWQHAVLEKLSPEGNSLWAAAFARPFYGVGPADVDLGDDGTLFVSFNSYLSASTFRFTEHAVPKAPQIVQNPEPSWIVQSCGEGITLQAEALGEGALQYQWYVRQLYGSEAVALSGATNETLVLPVLCAEGSGQYFLEVRNAYGVSVTRPVMVDVGFVPVLILEDHDTSFVADFARVNVGGSVRLRIWDLFPDVPDHRQWLFNGSSIDGATNAFLELANVNLTQAGLYSVVAANKYGTSTQAMRLYVEDRVRTVSEAQESAGWMPAEYEDPSPSLPRIAVNRSNEVYLLGAEFPEPESELGWFVSKYSPDGTQLWRHPHPGGDPASRGMALLLDSNDNILVVANETGNASEPGIRLVKLRPDGEVIWQSNYLNSPFIEREAHALVSNLHGDLFLAGVQFDYDPNVVTTSLFVMKLDANGGRLWESHAPQDMGYGYWNDRPYVAAANDGGVYAAGSLGLTRFSASGHTLWERAGEFNGIALDPADRIYVTRRWSGLACYDSSGSRLWNTDDGGAFPLAVEAGVFTFDPYRVRRHSTGGTRRWSSLPVGGNAAALAGGGGCYVARSLGTKVYARKLDANGSETWLATSVVDPELRGMGSAIAVCPNGDVVAVHLLFHPQSAEGLHESFYQLQWLRESTNAEMPHVQVTPATVAARPGERVCFTAWFDATPAEFQWFNGSYPVLGETNATYCVTANPYDPRDEFWIHVLTPAGGYASALGKIEMSFPFVTSPVPLENGMRRISIWTRSPQLPLVLESSTNLIHWEERFSWSPSPSTLLHFDFPQSDEGPMFFRAKQPAL